MSLAGHLTGDAISSWPRETVFLLVTGSMALACLMSRCRWFDFLDWVEMLCVSGYGEMLLLACVIKGVTVEFSVPDNDCEKEH